MQRKPLASQKIVKPRQRRKKAVALSKHEALPHAIVDGSFLQVPNARVYVWRSRTGERPQWHTCKVMSANVERVELWDETLEQWFCFDPRAGNLPDIRMEQAPT